MAAKNGELFPPAYFLSVTVENVRCFKGGQTLDLSDKQGHPAQWSVLLGDNGTGKTTLLQTLVWMQPFTFRVPDPEESFPVVPKCFITYAYGEVGRSISAGEREGAIEINAVVGSKLHPFRSPEAAIKVPYQFTRLGTGSTAHYPRYAQGLVCYAYGAGRRLGGRGLGEATTHEDACASLFDDDAALTDVERWILQAEFASLKSKDREAERHFSAVKAVLCNLLPGVKNVVIFQSEDPAIPPWVEVEHEGVRVPLRALSSGYRSVLVWMVDLVVRLFARYPEAKNPLEQPAIVLVDQIDLHLHPRWQRELIGRLSAIFKNTQFIVTAHSPLVVQAAAAVGANIAVLKREGDHVRICQDAESVRGWRVDQILASELFDEQPSRDAVTETLLKERRTLLGKKKLTSKERVRLEELEKKISPLPAAEDPADIEARQLIRRAAERLRQEQASAGAGKSKQPSGA